MADERTVRQKVLSFFYPALLKVSGKKTAWSNEKNIAPHTPLYALHLTLPNGTSIPLSQYRGKKILLVNTASACGYTHQYAELQQLQAQYKDAVAVLGFPSNDFGEQEKGTDAEIQQFCQTHYSLNFPLNKKSVVIKKQGQHPVYQWLSHPEQNGWCAQAPKWNFSKYIVDEQGVLTHYFDAAVSPLSTQILTALKIKIA